MYHPTLSTNTPSSAPARRPLGARSDGQGFRGILLGAKLGMALTTNTTKNVNGKYKKFFVYAGMARLTVNAKQTKLNILAWKPVFVELFEELLKNRPALTYFKAYYKNLSISDNGALTVLVCEDGRNENIESEREIASDFEEKLAKRLNEAFGNVDFTFTFRKRKDWLTKDISNMTSEHVSDDENIGKIKKILQPTLGGLPTTSPTGEVANA